MYVCMCVYASGKKIDNRHSCSFCVNKTIKQLGIGGGDTHIYIYIHKNTLTLGVGKENVITIVIYYCTFYQNNH